MKKSFIMALALVLVLGIAIGGTVAWLTATTETVTNTFTVGDINIRLTETWNTDSDGDNEKDKWVGTIVPGASEGKDPTVTVVKGSEKCYVYVKVTNNLVIGTDTVATLNISPDWETVETKGNTTLYRYENTVDASSADQKLTAVFTTVSYDGTKITKDNIGSLKDKTIEVQAYAHQSENTTRDTADAAAKAWAFPSAPA